jgi:hypothetical protein
MHMLAFGRSAPVPGWYWYCWLSAGMSRQVALVTTAGHCTPFCPGQPLTSTHAPALVVMRPVLRSCATILAPPDRAAAAAVAAQGTRAPSPPMHSVVERSWSSPLGSFAQLVNAPGASHGVATTTSPAAGDLAPHGATAAPPAARPSRLKWSYLRRHTITDTRLVLKNVYLSQSRISVAILMFRRWYCTPPRVVTKAAQPLGGTAPLNGSGGCGGASGGLGLGCGWAGS